MPVTEPAAGSALAFEIFGTTPCCERYREGRPECVHAAIRDVFVTQVVVASYVFGLLSPFTPFARAIVGALLLAVRDGHRFVFAGRVTVIVDVCNAGRIRILRQVRHHQTTRALKRPRRTLRGNRHALRGTTIDDEGTERTAYCARAPGAKRRPRVGASVFSLVSGILKERIRWPSHCHW